MMNVYCIAGMGMDERLFKYLKLNNCTIHHIHGAAPFNEESLSDYAIRLSKQIDVTKPFALIGVSFGGMCCIEIAKKLNPVRTFLISSSKTLNEIPQLIKMWDLFPFYKMFNDSAYISSALILKRQFGVITKENSESFEQMLNSAPENYFRGAAQCIINWENKEIPNNVIHIHGTGDQILPYKSIKSCNYTIENGTHFMVVTHAEEINKIINDEMNLI